MSTTSLIMDTTFDDTFLYDFSQAADPADFSSLTQLDFDDNTIQCLLDNPQDFATISVAPATTLPSANQGLRTPDSSSNVPLADPPTEAEEIKKLLQNLSTRIEDLERAVSAGNCQINQIGFNIDRALPKLLSATEDFRETIDNLRKSLKVFSRELVNHLLGWYVEGDAEAEQST
ncbi:hypothetical protein FOTG_00048 [Fusarium oxysporum f. sp. vasinfectum 25433]|uniref:Uncharacterized protein n=1 Tax=Fusarium oxysporum f. sp. vasinfectum 25433 TaxID=1089449 RepID=X0MBQ2_FUSOX|nr:hypothetical protein FOTG_00048 [Fusarium oxysporum f. sp. vasinfectum 25433]